MTSLIIHGHFYQPPRENPWTGVIDREESAAPFDNWNERILAECYRANGFARIIDSRGRVERIVNNYTNLSFG
jgi:alpha-amylase/alpha-mannosidase (GH57 family)